MNNTPGAESDLRYPIGKFQFDGEFSDERRNRWIDEIERTPESLGGVLRGLATEQLETAYRPGGWTVRQVAHHLPDSHLNGYVRFKLALTEVEPTIMPYDQAAWADLRDSRDTPVDVSLILLTSLHRRWVAILRGMSPTDFTRGFRHPEQRRIVQLAEALGLYAWHGRHHVAQIERLREREGW